MAATTSSTGLLANELRPITVPRAAAARATATSPSGWTACTPVGEMITGSEIGWPMTVVVQVALRRQPGHVRREAQLAEGGSTLSLTVSPFSAPAISAP